MTTPQNKKDCCEKCLNNCIQAGCLHDMKPTCPCHFQPAEKEPEAKYEACPAEMGACPKVPHDGVCGCACHSVAKEEKLPHASEGGTHWTCEARLKKNGGKSYCCDCVPHKNCGNPQPKEEGEREHKCNSKDYCGSHPVPTPAKAESGWEASFDKEFMIPKKVGELYYITAEVKNLKSFIRQLLEKEREMSN